MVMLSSADGKLLREMSQISTPGLHLKIKNIFSLIEKHNLILMGRSTYEAVRSRIKLQKKIKNCLTHNLKNILNNQSRIYLNSLMKNHRI